MSRKVIGLLVVACMMMTMLGGIAQARTESELEPITFSVFLKNDSNFDTEVGREITRKTGVTLDFVPIAGDSTEKLNVMLASGDYPDILSIDRNAEANKNYITAGAVIPYDDYLDSVGANIVSMLGDTMKKVRFSDGKLYGIPSWYQSDVSPSPVFGFNIKMNYVQELGYYDTYVEKGYFTQDEFTSLLKEWKEKYPTINGKETLPIIFNGENIGSHTLSFAGMYGIGSYYENDGTLYHNVRDPRYKEMYMYINSLNVDGLLDRDWIINTNTTFDEKMSNGYVLSAPAAYWNIGANNVFSSDESGNPTPDEMFYPFKVVADGTDPAQTTYGPTSVLGWLLTYVSSNCKDPERAVSFLDYLISEEGQYLTQWGVEGKIWNMEDGKRVLTEEALDTLSTDFWTASTSLGFRRYEIVFKSGIAQDGQNYDLWSVYSELTGTRDYVKEFAVEYLGDSCWDTTLYDNLGPTAGTPDSLINTKLNDITTAGLPNVIMASSQEEASKLFDDMVAEMEAAGLETIELITNENYQAKLAVWDQ